MNLCTSQSLVKLGAEYTITWGSCAPCAEPQTSHMLHEWTSNDESVLQPEQWQLLSYGYIHE